VTGKRVASMRRRSRALPERAHGAAPGSAGHGEQLAGCFLLGTGAGVSLLWAASLPGAFRGGLFTYAGTPEAGNIPVFHVVAEAGMAASSLVAGTALLRGWQQRRGAALTACGMLIYSSLNSSGWLLRNQPAVTAVTGATLAGSLAVVRCLLRRPDGDAHRTVSLRRPA
jgi:hypothetical protein